MDAPNPHPIGSLAYWKHCLASLEQRMGVAASSGFRIKARRLRDDANEVRTIIDRVKAEDAPKQPWTVIEGVTEEDLAQYHSYGDLPPSDIGAQAIQVTHREPQPERMFPCIDCGKLHHGLHGRCRDCKNIYKSRSNSPKQERERLRYQQDKLRRRRK